MSATYFRLCIRYQQLRTVYSLGKQMLLYILERVCLWQRHSCFKTKALRLIRVDTFVVCREPGDGQYVMFRVITGSRSQGQARS